MTDTSKIIIDALHARVAELEAAQPEMVAEVKPLVWWAPCKANNYTVGAETIFGTYYVGSCGGRNFAHAEFFHEEKGIEQFNGPDRGSQIEAQMDARRHHNKRIQSAITLTTKADAIREGMERAALAVETADLLEAYEQGRRIHFDDLQEFFAEEVRKAMEDV